MSSPFGRMGVDEVQLDARVRPAQLGGRLRYERAEDRLETGESYPAGAKADPAASSTDAAFSRPRISVARCASSWQF
jgi:hypothetical protein